MPSPTGVTPMPPLSLGAAKCPGRGAPSGRSEGPNAPPAPLTAARGLPHCGGREGGVGTPIPPSPTRRFPHAPLPSQLCGRGLSPPTSALPCGRRVYLHIRVRAGASDTPLAGLYRVTRPLTNPARGTRALPVAAYRRPRGRGPPARAA